jgi:hypothetical protein
MVLGTGRWAHQARAALACALGLGLVACQSAPPAPSPPPQVEAAPPPQTPPPPPHPDKKPVPPVLASLPPAVSEEPAPDVAELQGLDQDDTIAILGEPQQRADAPPAVLWRYASRGCELDLYFYLDLQTREMRILHYEVRVTDGSNRSQQGCYGELVAARRADEAGSADRPR